MHIALASEETTVCIVKYVYKIILFGFHLPNDCPYRFACVLKNKQKLMSIAICHSEI